MTELFDTQPDTEVQEREYKRLLGYPVYYELTGRAAELADWARQWYVENGKPWVYARPAEELYAANGLLRIDGAEFMSKRLHDQLIEARAHSVMLVAASAGKECEEKAHQLWLEEKPDEYFFLEVYGSAVVEHLITTTGARFCAWAEQEGFGVLPHYSPGYPEWEISDQSRLLELIRQKQSLDFPGEIQVLNTGMLKPKKSLLAVFGITAQVARIRDLRELMPCESCSMRACQYRRAPYEFSRSRIEDVRRLQPPDHEGSKEQPWHDSALTRDAKYTISTRALDKWSKERLHLRMKDDHSIEARFRYEGTTCTNMGRRLEYDYQVKLSSASEGYRIVELQCLPAQDDTGHTYMCEYIRNAEALLSTIANEKPLLGKSLNEVLFWTRPYSPSGCYCDAGSREHKWGLVLEVVHYALAKYEEQSARNKTPRATALEHQI